MSKGWRTATVAELQCEGVLLVEDGNHGEYRPRPDEFVPEGTVFIRAADMNQGEVLFQSASRITLQARQRITKGIGAPGDVLLSHKGTVGKVALVLADAPPFVCSPQTTFWRTLNQDVLDRQYLYAFLRSPVFHHQLATRSGETDMAPYVSLTSQRAFSVTLPPITLQRAIGSVFGALDDKIELNRRMNRTIEAMAQAIFRSWFVDFDPVRAKAAGQQPPGLSPEIAALFPDCFQDSELGEIPRGWSLRPIGDLVQVLGGGTPSTKESSFWEGGVHPFCTPKDMAGLSDNVLLQTERRLTSLGLERVSSGELPAGTVLLSSRAPIGYLAITEIPVSVNQGIIAMICDSILPNLYVLHWTSTNMERIVANANGSTFLEISKMNFRPITALVPPGRLLQHFTSLARPLHQRVVASLRETAALTALRDALLPALVSGQLTMPDAERIVGKFI